MIGFEPAFGATHKTVKWLKLPAILVLLRFCFLAPSIHLVGCANMVAPSGGPRDSLPPQLIHAQPVTGSTRFKGDKITWQFNEFVRIQNRGAIRFLPETNKLPMIREALNRIEVDFGDVNLDSATTYVLYLGDALVDFTEGNKHKDFKHVFSTGLMIDTGWVSGKVVDALGSKARPNVRVGLYDWIDAGDSVVYGRKARYWTTTDDSGQFYLGYLPNRSFRLFVWADESKDGLYQAGESFDFADVPLRPKQGLYDSSLMCMMRLTIDRDEQSRVVEYSEKWPGWLGITFSARPSVCHWEILGKTPGDTFIPVDTFTPGDSFTHFPFWKGDTVFVFVGEAYNRAELGGVVAFCTLLHRTDTIFRRPKTLVDPRMMTDTAKSVFPQLKALSGGVPELCAGHSRLPFSSDRPLQRIDAAQVMWVDTVSGQTVQRGAIWQQGEGSFSILAPQGLNPGKIYKLFIPRGAIIGAGEQVFDSVVQIFKVVPDSQNIVISNIVIKTPEKCGELTTKVGTGFIAEIVDASGYTCGVFRFMDAEQGQWADGKTTLRLLPGAYTITVFSDENNNMRPDAASWRLNRRAEFSRKAQWKLSPNGARALELDLCELIWE
jgi:hypothetical protein